MMEVKFDMEIFQILYVCQQLAELPELRWGYHAIGFSQVNENQQ
jgi:hypothetical protein